MDVKETSLEKHQLTNAKIMKKFTKTKSLLWAFLEERICGYTGLDVFPGKTRALLSE